MSAVELVGTGVVSAAGYGHGALAAAVAAGAPLRCADAQRGQPVPTAAAPVLDDPDPRRRLGRKGTSFLDRVTVLTLVAGELLLADSGWILAEGDRDRIGAAIATTTGGLTSTCEFSAETLSDRPYLVNPVLFPNTVMNCAAGQLAIRFGLRGVNATLATGQLGLLAALGYVRRLIQRGHAEAMIVGAGEEYTPYTAWLAHRGAGEHEVVAGEGAALFAVLPAGAAAAAGRRADAEVLAVATGFGTGEPDPLVSCLRRVLAAAQISTSEIATVVTGEAGPADQSQRQALRRLGALPGAEWLLLKPMLGECGAASAALHTAAVLARHRERPDLDGQITLVTARAGGAAGAMLLRGWSRHAAAAPTGAVPVPEGTPWRP